MQKKNSFQLELPQTGFIRVEYSSNPLKKMAKGVMERIVTRNESEPTIELSPSLEASPDEADEYLDRRGNHQTDPPEQDYLDTVMSKLGTKQSQTWWAGRNKKGRKRK